MRKRRQLDKKSPLIFGDGGNTACFLVEVNSQITPDVKGTERSIHNEWAVGEAGHTPVVCVVRIFKFDFAVDSQ